MDIKEAILKTVCFFDSLNFPLTLREINFYLWQNAASLEETRKNLRKMIGKELSRKGEYYFLKGQEDLVKTRRGREKISKKKWKKAKRIINLLRVIPFIKGVAVTQNLALKNCKESSDADLLIITSPGKIWITRAFVNLILDIFRKRNPKNKNRICPSFFITSNNLNIKDIALKPLDIYLVYWIKSLKPVFGSHFFYEFDAYNFWAYKSLPNAEPDFKNQLVFNPIFRILQKFLEILIWPFSKKLENFLKTKQLKIIDKNKNKLSKSPSIVTTERMIKIHYEDKRKFYLNEWQKKTETLKEKIKI